MFSNTNETVLGQFIKDHESGQASFLTCPSDSSHASSSASESYAVVKKNPKFISDYAYHHLKKIEHLLNGNQIDFNLAQKTASFIYLDYKKQNKQMNVVKKTVCNILSGVGVYRTSKEVEAMYQGVQAVYDQGNPVRLGQAGTNQEKEQRRNLHRNPQSSGYSKISPSAHFANLYKQKEAGKKEALAKLPPEKRAIAIAALKESAYQETYDTQLQGCIDGRFYDPEIIPYDIECLLGEAVHLKRPVVSSDELESLLKQEVGRYRVHDKLNQAQAARLEQDAIAVAKLYGKAFPGKSFRDAFFLVSDLIRIATYQEYYDKASFSGSDHGSKHIHHNILGSLALHKGMRKGEDFSSKDQLIEMLTHFYHDIGYTVGLSSTNFDCCKDHPFIGAKMIECNREYFIHYLDESSYKALHRSVLYHAIVYPDLTAREEENGIHPNMIRAATSISDACAVTYDRKTQEFWEQPRAIVALARLKSFLVLFPQYQKKLGGDIANGKWTGYDETNPLDKMAYDVFMNTESELYRMMQDYDIPQEKRELFDQAIRQQFNAFTAKITLGQYGAVLAGIEAVRNAGKTDAGAPDYLPQVNIGISIAYGVLKDLFGEDQAQGSFKKLVEEFGGDMKDLHLQLQTISEGINREDPQKDTIISSGVARFKLLGRLVKTPAEEQSRGLEASLRLALMQIHEVFDSQKKLLSERGEVIQSLENWTESYKRDKLPPFSAFVLEHLLPVFPVPGKRAVNTGITKELEVLTALASKQNLDDKDLDKIKGVVAIVLMSKKEYEFMRGKDALINRDEMLTIGA